MAVVKVRKWRRFGLVAASVALAAGAPAIAQAPPPSAAPIHGVPALPEDAKGIPLRAGAPIGAPEQWESFGGQTIVRNVTAPSLTPVLPDPAKATGAAVIVAPGGGFLMLSMDNEGYPVARWLADHGVAAFVLKYRTRETPRVPQAFVASMGDLMRVATTGKGMQITMPAEALADAQAAVRMVRARAKEWGVDPNRVGFLGFSAGAMTALSVGLSEDKAARPDFIAPIYGPLTALPVPPDAPPMFLAVALDDPLMARGKSIELIDSWRAAKRPVEAHLYARGGHGFGMLGKRPASRMWIDEFYAWMSDSGWLKPKS